MLPNIVVIIVTFPLHVEPEYVSVPDAEYGSGVPPYDAIPDPETINVSGTFCPPHGIVGILEDDEYDDDGTDELDPLELEDDDKTLDDAELDEDEDEDEEYDVNGTIKTD